MRNKQIDNARVGMLVLFGMVFLVFTLYMIGKNRNLLGSTFTIKAVLSNVNGLVPGNNVRFKGIDVGTVKSITVANDTAILVTMTIDNEMKPFIKKNAIASVGTDGLMGNKLININSDTAPSSPIEKDDVIKSRQPIETDEMLRTLNTTNENIEKITSNLYEISVKLNSSESLWTLLSDTAITRDLKTAVAGFRKAGVNTAAATTTAKEMMQKLESGNGIAYQLFNDTTLAHQLTYSLEQIQEASDQISHITQDLKEVVDDVNQGDGPAGLLLKDSLLRQSLRKSAINVEEGTDRFNQNMEALKSNFLFKRYFRKLEKDHKKTSEAKSN